jgi:hypothetical protein
LEEASIIGLLPLVLIAVVIAAVMARRRRAQSDTAPRASLLPRGALFYPFAVILVAAIAVAVDWGSFLYDVADQDEAGDFFWAESAITSTLFSALAVSLFVALRDRPVFVPISMLLLIYLFFILFIYRFAFSIIGDDFFFAIEELLQSLFSIGSHRENFEFWITSPIYLLHGLAIILAAFLLMRGRQAGEVQAVGALGYGGRKMNFTSSEIMRLLLGSAVLNGSLFRRKVVDHLEERHLAVSPYLDVDLDVIGRVCKMLERRETLYQAIYLVLAVLALLFSASPGSEPVALVFLVAIVLVHLYKEGKNRFQLAARIKAESDAPEAGLLQALQPLTFEGFRVPSRENSVVVYRDFDPFASFGTAIAHISFSVDTGRAKAEPSDEATPTAFNADELYSALRERISALKLLNLEISERLFVHGEDLPPALRGPQYGPPLQKLSAEEVVTLDADPENRARRYMWFVARDWGGEIVVSFFANCVIRGRTLFVEVNGRILPPLARGYRKIERIPPRNWRTVLTWLVTTTVVAPFAALLGALLLIAKFFESVSRLIGSDERARRRQINTLPRYNFGAMTALRSSFASQQFAHYFQRMDMDYYIDTFNQSLFNIIVDFLDEHGIDTTNLKEQQVSIINSGILIQGGNLSAQNLAVGEGARANLLQKAAQATRQRAGRTATKGA